MSELDFAIGLTFLVAGILGFAWVCTPPRRPSARRLSKWCASRAERNGHGPEQRQDLHTRGGREARQRAEAAGEGARAAHAREAEAAHGLEGGSRALEAAGGVDRRPSARRARVPAPSPSAPPEEPDKSAAAPHVHDERCLAELLERAELAAALGLLAQHLAFAAVLRGDSREWRFHYQRSHLALLDAEAAVRAHREAAVQIARRA